MKKYDELTAGCLFSGMGGFCLGLKEAGINTIWANEKDNYAAETFKHNFPDVDLHPYTIEKLSPLNGGLDPVDILTAGFPCQSFSQAGNKRGFEDDRGKLFFDVIRILKEFGEDRPKIIIMENVPHLQYGDGGRWMKKIIKEVQRAGYWFSARNCKVLNTSAITYLPQNRERLFMVAFSTNFLGANNFQFPKEVPENIELQAIIDRCYEVEKSEYLPEDNKYYHMINKKIDLGNPLSIYQLRKYLVREYSDICPTLTANMGAGGHNVPFVKDKWGIRRLQVDECLMFQGFDPNKFSFPESLPKSRMYMQIGNTVTVPVVKKLAKNIVKTIDGLEVKYYES